MVMPTASPTRRGGGGRRCDPTGPCGPRGPTGQRSSARVRVRARRASRATARGAPLCRTASRPSSWRRRSPLGRPRRGTAGVSSSTGARCCQCCSRSAAVPGTARRGTTPGVADPGGAGGGRGARRARRTRRARCPRRATAWCWRRHTDQCRWCARAAPAGWVRSSSRRRTSGTVSGKRDQVLGASPPLPAGPASAAPAGRAARAARPARDFQVRMGPQGPRAVPIPGVVA